MSECVSCPAKVDKISCALCDVRLDFMSMHISHRGMAGTVTLCDRATVCHPACIIDRWRSHASDCEMARGALPAAALARAEDAATADAQSLVDASAAKSPNGAAENAYAGDARESMESRMETRDASWNSNAHVYA